MSIQQLRERYAEPEIPKCRVCGSELTVQRAGGGPTIWGCTGMIDDPTGERNWIYAEGRSCADEHYERSRWSDYRQGGDADVIELIDQLESAERERDEAILTRLEVSEGLSIATRRYEAAEAELARRDAAVGEAVGKFVFEPIGKRYHHIKHGEYQHSEPKLPAIKLYTAAQPAGSPVLEQDVKNIIGLLSVNEWAEHCTKSELGRELEGEVTRLHDLRAQQQKVVVIPYSDIVIKQVFGIDAYRADDVLAALDAANVKWEVKK